MQSVGALGNDNSTGRFDDSWLGAPDGLYSLRIATTGSTRVAFHSRLNGDVVDTVHATCDAYVREGEVRLTAACWMIGVRA